MTSKERVLTALDHKQPDRCPCDYISTPEVDAKIKEYFQTSDMDFVLEKLGSDLRVVDAPYVGPALRTWDDGRFENYWGSIRKPVTNEAGTYNEAVELPYAAFKSIEDVDQFPKSWPDSETVRSDMLDYAFEIEDFDVEVRRARRGARLVEDFRPGRSEQAVGAPQRPS